MIQFRLDMKFSFLGIKQKSGKNNFGLQTGDSGKQGREQFKKLLEKGISIPVVLFIKQKRASLSLLGLISSCTISNALGKRVISPLGRK